MYRKNLFRFLFFSLISICFHDLSIGQTPSTTEKNGSPAASGKTSGFYNVTTFSPVTFSGEFLTGIQTICGYRVNRYLAIGGGIGYEHYKSMLMYADYKADLSLLPVFVDIRYTPLTGKISPVVALNGGYKILLNKPSTQVRYDTVYNSVLFVSTRDDNAEYNVYNQGGPFVTAEIGVRANVFKKAGLYLALDYSLWSVSGTYHLSDKYELQGSDNIWRWKSTTETTDKSLAYCHVFLVRLGIVF